MFTGNRDGTGGDRGIDESRAIGRCAGKREKHIARLYVAAVRGKARDGQLARARVHGGIVAEKLAKFHALLVPARAAGPAFTASLEMPQE
jgi:hypothetical protein